MPQVLGLVSHPTQGLVNIGLFNSLSSNYLLNFDTDLKRSSLGLFFDRGHGNRRKTESDETYKLRLFWWVIIHNRTSNLSDLRPSNFLLICTKDALLLYTEMTKRGFAMFPPAFGMASISRSIRFKGFRNLPQTTNAVRNNCAPETPFKRHAKSVKLPQSRNQYILVVLHTTH